MDDQKCRFKSTGFFFIFLFLVSNVFSQTEEWTLEQCVTYAVQNNIQLKQGQLNQAMAEMQVQQSKYDLTPNVNGTFDLGLNLGRSIDPTTNQFLNQTTWTNQYGLSLSQEVFSGLTKLKTIDKNKIDVQAIALDNESLKTNLELNLLTAYLNILNAEEQLEQAKISQKSTEEQLQRTQTLIKAGALAEKAIIDIETQKISEEATITNLENQVKLAYNTLKNILQLEPGKDIKIKKPEEPDVVGNQVIETPETIYSEALKRRPEIKSQQLKIESSKLSLSIAKGAYLPTISLFSSFGTGYSNQFRNYDFSDPLNPIVSKVSYGNQLNDNIGYNMGIRLTIPIYNKRLPYFGMRQAEFGIQNADFQLKTAELQLYENIKQAYLRATTAQANYNISLKSLEASNKSLEYAKERLDRGVLTQIEYTVAKNVRDAAQSRVSQAKYEYIFSTKVLDFYMGKDIQLD
ncbi:MAG: TolC family protein [Chitinophagales bacterium]|nr:TolC family protein [Chitinophagales bacterium]